MQSVKCPKTIILVFLEGDIRNIITKFFDFPAFISPYPPWQIIYFVTKGSWYDIVCFNLSSSSSMPHKPPSSVPHPLQNHLNMGRISTKCFRAIV